MGRGPERTLFKRRHTNGQQTWQDAQHHSSSGKCKSNPQWDSTSYLSEWLVSKCQETTNASKDVEKALLVGM